MTRTTKTIGLTIATLTMCSLLPVARAAQPNPAMSSNVLAQAASIRAEAKSVTSLAAKATGDYQEALTRNAEAKQVLAEALTRWAAAYASGEDDALKASGTEVATARYGQWCASERTEVQRILSTINPNEKVAAGEAEKALLDAYLAARQKVVSDGNMFLAKITPEAAQADIEVARDTWIQCQNDLWLTRWALDRANDRARCAARKEAADPTAAAKLAEIASIDDEYFAAQKDAKAQSLKVRVLERKRAAAQREFDAACKNAPKP